MKDHLGNVRVTFTTKDETVTDVATMEASNQVSENTKFLRYNNVRLVNSYLFDHTNDKNGVPSGNAIRLSGSLNEKEGLAKSLSVMPGDRIDMKVYAKYVDPAANQNTFAPVLQTLLGYLSGVGTAPGGTIIDGSGYSTSTSSFPASHLGLLDKSGSTGGPKAYLNYLIYDRDYNFKNGGFVRMGATAKEDGTNVKHDSLMASITVQEAGYVYIYLSNEEATPVEVFFDDMKVTQVKSPVIASNDYYPFGMVSQSYSRENAVPNPYQYNGKEIQDELNLGWLDYGARMYQSDIGRWGIMDPLSDQSRRWSPYNYTMDNPIRFIDPDGMETESPYYTASGKYLGVDENGFSGEIKVTDEKTFEQNKENGIVNSEKMKDESKGLSEADVTAEGLSKIYTHVLSEGGYKVSEMEGGKVAVNNGDDKYNDPQISNDPDSPAATQRTTDKVSVNQQSTGATALNTVEGIWSLLGDHEMKSHVEEGVPSLTGHYKAYLNQMNNTNVWDCLPTDVQKSIFRSFDRIMYQYDRKAHDDYFRVTGHKHYQK